MTHLRPQRPLFTLLLALLLGLVGPFAPRPAPALAQVAAGSGFASAVPCLSGAPTFATTSMANTILNTTAILDATDPALLQITATSSAKLVGIGASDIYGTNSPVVNGIGATYGLAYDDGSISGIRRIFAAAYLKRSVGLGSAGPGAIYEYRFATGTYSPSPAAVVPNVGSPNRPATNVNDTGMTDQVGKVGLGDLEVSPDGRTLYAMNLNLRRIERYDISGGALVPLSPLDIPFGLISSDPAVQADLRPFALGFYPLATLSATSGPSLVVGLVDSGERSIHKNNSPPWVAPTAYVLGKNTGSAPGAGWGVAVAQNLRAPTLFNRLISPPTTYMPGPGSSLAQIGPWNPWGPVSIVGLSRSDGAVRFPQPMLTDITFSQDGQTMFLGLRDRTGDQYFTIAPPAGDLMSLAQGDVLTYKLSGGAWWLQGDGKGDLFDDNTHAYPGAPTALGAHVENFMGAAAISLSGTGPNNFSEQLMATSLLGANSRGTRTYASSGGGIVNQQRIDISAGNPLSGKAATLGDVEVLCSYALVGGRLWQDNDADGVQDAGEPGIPNVRMELFRNQGSGASGALAPPIASLTTDAQGRYLFAAPPNTPVNIRIAASSRATLFTQGWRLTDPNVGGNDATDSDASNVDGYIELEGQRYGKVEGGLTGMAMPVPLNRADQRTHDIGLTRVAAVGTIGDRVWDDLDHDGVQDTGEPGHAGLAVTLTADPSNAAILPAGYVQTTTTDSSGRYLFKDLPPGRYRVTFATPPAPFSATLRDRGGSDAADSDADASTGYATPYVTILAPPNHVNTTLDLGLFGGVPDVWVTKSGPAQALVGGTFSYTLDYGNAGALAAAGVQLRDTLPAGLSYVSASPAPSSVSGQVLTWNLGSLIAGQVGAITLTVRAPASIGAATSQPVTNTASITTTSPNDPTGNNSSSSSGTLVRPEVSIVKSGPATALVGDEYSYTLAYANSGSFAAATVQIADTLPAGVALTRFIQNPGGACSYTAASRRVSCTFASLAAGASGSVVFAAKADVSAAASVANTATIATATTGDDPANNSSTATTTVQFPNPGVGASISPSPFPVGASGSITATYRNTGTGVARSSSLSMSIPSGVTLGSLPSGCAYSAGPRTLTCPLGDLASGASGSRVIPVSLPATFAADRLDVTATIATTTPERPADQGDNTATASVSVVRPNVFVTAAGPASIVGQGSAFWYTVNYGNQYRANPSLTRTAEGVVLTATLPGDVTFVSADVAPSSVSGQTLSWDLGTLAPNAGGQ
ncbi:DUF11 domain-containing protein, partial [Oscillochloris sp. ZM17-4]|uniref:SdrD B-like domain-containing protein n=1 Tax=Oscillochloris sp. ZM17-4 TaxID=2866714 RepID=UPI001C736ACD